MGPRAQGGVVPAALLSTRRRQDLRPGATWRHEPPLRPRCQAAHVSLSPFPGTHSGAGETAEHNGRVPGGPCALARGRQHASNRHVSTGTETRADSSQPRGGAPAGITMGSAAGLSAPRHQTLDLATVGGGQGGGTQPL